MNAQRLEILELLPESERVSPAILYLPESARGDSEALVQGLIDWVNFLREEACFPTESLSPEMRALYQAAGYHHGVYNDWHALFLYNLRRNETLEETLPLIRDGLARLATPEFAENFAEAERIYRANEAAWDAADFSSYSDAYAQAKALMAPVDQRYWDLLDRHDLEALIARAIGDLPGVQFVTDSAYAAAKEVALRSSPDRNARVVHLIAGQTGREAAEVAAEQIRARRSLEDSVDFAGRMLAEMAGYAAVISMGPGTSDTTEEGQEIEIWPIVLRTGEGGAQHNHLVRGGGNFALLDYQLDNVHSAATEIDLEYRRLKLLREHGGEPKPARTGLFGLFSRRR